MYIKNIKLKNYRNYESLNGDQGLDLGKQTTVLIGKNGMGKTNMINALKQSLSFMFTKSSKVGQSNFIANTMQKVKSFNTTDATRLIGTDGLQSSEGSWPVVIRTIIDIDEPKPLDVVFRRDNLSSGMRELFTSSSIEFWEHYKRLEDLPVLAFYSDSFPHEKVTIGQKIQDLLNSKGGISQSAGYYNWDDPRDCGLVWQQYYAMQWRNVKYGQSDERGEKYLKEISASMIKFSAPLPDSPENKDFILRELALVARGNRDVVVLRFSNGIESDFESLPAGYRRAFLIAFDLSNRAFLLNQNCDPNGICFIDEVDLHLHPSLAQEILDRLRSAFPKMQFIVSTHSPVVLSNFKQNEENIVYRLLASENKTILYERVSDLYGIDYNSLLEDYMDSPVRNSLLRELLESYSYWKDVGDENRMKMIRSLIIDKVGLNSNLVPDL